MLTGSAKRLVRAPSRSVNLAASEMQALTPQRRRGLLVLGLALCACGTQSSSLRARSGGERATVGCLDVAVAAHRDAAIRHAVEVQFANRCDRAVLVDFTALRAEGRGDGGHRFAMLIHDPRGEIRPLELEARTTGREVLEVTSDRAAPSPARMCLDVGRIAGSPDGPPRWLCAARIPGGSP